MKLTYEDCKELKDAGFPLVFIESNKTEVIKAPTLLELIESCGEGFFVLQRGVNNHWVASIGESNHFLGDSPEQAVKNLWVAINKVKNAE